MKWDKPGPSPTVKSGLPKPACEQLDLSVTNEEERVEGGDDLRRRVARGVLDVETKDQRLARVTTKTLLIGGAKTVKLDVDDHMLLIKQAKESDARGGELA